MSDEKGRGEERKREVHYESHIHTFLSTDAAKKEAIYGSAYLIRMPDDEAAS